LTQALLRRRGPRPTSSLPSNTEPMRDFIAGVQKAVREALEPLERIRDGVAAALEEEEARRAGTVGFVVEGEPGELRIMARYGECFDEVMTVCYDIEEEIQRSFVPNAVEEENVAAQTCADWFRSSLWPQITGVSHLLRATLHIDCIGKSLDLPS